MLLLSLVYRFLLLFFTFILFFFCLCCYRRCLPWSWQHDNPNLEIFFYYIVIVVFCFILSGCCHLVLLVVVVVVMWLLWTVRRLIFSARYLFVIVGYLNIFFYLYTTITKKFGILNCCYILFGFSILKILGRSWSFRRY